MKNVVDYDDFVSRMKSMKIVEFGGDADAASSFSPDATMTFDCSLQTIYHKNFNLIADSFTKFLNDGYKILILSDTPFQNERLKAIFEDRGDKISFTPVDHTIHEGFVDHESKICFFTDHQIFDRFHKYNLKSDRARGGKLAPLAKGTTAD